MSDHATNDPTNGKAADERPDAAAAGELPAGRHPRTRAEERADAVRTPTRSELVDELSAVRSQLEALRTESDEHLRSWQRAVADLTNYRRRTDEERSATAQMANAILVDKLLGVLDDFDRALASVPEDAHEGWVDGVRLVERKLRAVLEAEGVTPIEALGVPFDPNLHEAVLHERTTEHPDNVVIGEVQRGYRLHGRVLRPALVRVANNPSEHEH
jgi:molecular chaperone GrpE